MMVTGMGMAVMDGDVERGNDDHHHDEKNLFRTCYLTIISRWRWEYCGIIPKTKSRGDHSTSLRWLETVFFARPR